MPEQVHAFDELATRDGFNRSLRHFKFISRVIGDFEGKRNIADTLSDCLADKSIEPRQVLPTLNAILVDKYHYASRSHNIDGELRGLRQPHHDGGQLEGHRCRGDVLPPGARGGRCQPEEPGSLGGGPQPQAQRAGDRVRRRLRRHRRRQEVRRGNRPPHLPDRGRER